MHLLIHVSAEALIIWMILS